MKNKLIVFSGVAVLLIVLLWPFTYKKIDEARQRALLINELKKYPQGLDFISQDSRFIDSFMDYPEIVMIVKNAIKTNPSFIGFFRNNKDFIEEIKASERQRRIYLFFSKYPAILSFALSDFENLRQTTRRHPLLAEHLIKHPDYAHYLSVEHPERFREIIDSPDPAGTAKKILDRFIIDKYIRSSK